jgi:hypothetical protein
MLMARCCALLIAFMLTSLLARRNLLGEIAADEVVDGNLARTVQQRDQQQQTHTDDP